MASGGTEESLHESKPAPKPARRPLFKKSAYKKPVEDVSDEIDFFSRRKEVFNRFVEEEQEQATKDKLEKEKKKAAERIKHRDPERWESKRRRISEEPEQAPKELLEKARREFSDSDDELADRLLRGAQRSSTTTPPLSRRSRSASAKKGEISPKARKPSTLERKSLNTRSKKINVIVLSDSEDDAPLFTQSTGSTLLNINYSDGENDYLPKPAPEPEEVLAVKEVDSDEELFPELVAEARQLAAQQQRFPHLGMAGESGSVGSGAFTPRPMRDPVVKILVTSRIEGTKPLIMKRRASQRTKEVRLMWCDAQLIDGQPMSAEQKDCFFLTWKEDIRMFDSSSCSALGVKGNSSFSGLNQGFDEDGNLHFEAWDEATYKQFQDQKAEERRKMDQDPMEYLEETHAEPVPEEPVEEKIRIILHAKGLEPVKLVIKPTIPVIKLIQAFKLQREIPLEKDVSLWFDGDKLDPACKMSDADVDDMSTIDVHIN